MICPNCGAQVADSRFCENCGAPLAAAAEATQPVIQEAAVVDQFGQQPVAGAPIPPASVTQPYDQQGFVQQPYDQQPTAQMPYGQQPTAQMPYGQQPAAQPYEQQPTAQMPVDQQPAAQPYVQQPTAQMPVEQQPYAQAPMGQPPVVQQPVAGGGVTPYSQVEAKKGGSGKRTIAIVAVVAVALVAIIAIGMNVFGGSGSGSGSSAAPAAASSTAASASAEASSSSAASSGAVVAPSSASAASTPSASGAASSAAASSASAASASASAVSPSANVPAEALDSRGNITLYAITQLKGSDLDNLLESSGYAWDTNEEAYVKNEKDFFGAILQDGTYMWQFELRGYEAGGGTFPVIFMLSVDGYANTSDAMAAQNVVTEKSVEYTPGSIAAIVYGPNMVRYMAIAVQEDNGSVDIALFNEASMSSGMFGDMIFDDDTITWTFDEALQTLQS